MRYRHGMHKITCAGDALKTWRSLHRWSQEQLAGHLGIGKANVSHFECGRQLPRLETAVAIEKITGIAPREWLMDLEVFRRKEAA